MRRWVGGAWAPFVVRSAAGAVLPWPRVVPLPDVLDLFDHYVSTDGSSSNDGSLNAPWSLSYALAGAGGAVLPGETVGIRAGTYTAPSGSEWTASLSGADGSPVTLRAYPGERVTIDSADTNSTAHKLWRTTGNYLRIWGLEFQFTGSLIRESVQVGGDGSNPTDIGGRNAKEVRNEGHHNQFVWCISHDGCGGFTDQNAATSYASEYHHCISYNNGWLGTDRGHGHGWYMQNEDAAGKALYDCVTYGNFSTGFKISGSSGSFLKYFTVSGSCSFNNEVYGGGGGDSALHIEGADETGSGPHTLTDNLFWTKAGLGTALKVNASGATPISSVVVERNVVVGKTDLNECDAYTILDNTFTRFQTVANGERAIGLRMEAGQVYASHTVDRNTYVQPAEKFPWFLTKADGSTAIYNSLANWSAETGYDAAGTFTDAEKPTGSEVVYRPDSTFEPGSGWIYCANWGGAASLDMDLAEMGFAAGDDYEVHHVYDLFGDAVASGTYDGSTALSLGQAGYVHPTPLGWEGDVPDSSAPYLNVFRVRKVA